MVKNRGMITEMDPSNRKNNDGSFIIFVGFLWRDDCYVRTREVQYRYRYSAVDTVHVYCTRCAFNIARPVTAPGPCLPIPPTSREHKAATITTPKQPSIRMELSSSIEDSCSSASTASTDIVPLDVQNNENEGADSTHSSKTEQQAVTDTLDQIHLDATGSSIAESLIIADSQDASSDYSESTSSSAEDVDYERYQCMDSFGNYPQLTLETIAHWLVAGKCSNVLVLSGAGVSVAAGIPDFRTPGSGL